MRELSRRADDPRVTAGMRLAGRAAFPQDAGADLDAAVERVYLAMERRRRDEMEARLRLRLHPRAS